MYNVNVQCTMIYSYSCTNTMDTNIDNSEMRLALLKKQEELSLKKLSLKNYNSL
jgi:hypothetical protein